MKKFLLGLSVMVLLTSATGVASAAPATKTSEKEVVSNLAAKSIEYTIKLRSNGQEQYQLGYGSGYKYHVNQGSGGPYFTVSSTGLVTAVKMPLTSYNEPIGGIYVVDRNGNELEHVYVVVDSF